MRTEHAKHKSGWPRAFSHGSRSCWQVMSAVTGREEKAWSLHVLLHGAAEATSLQFAVSYQSGAIPAAR